MLAWLSTIYFSKNSELCASLFSPDIKHPHLAEILTEMSDFKWCSIALFPVESCKFWLSESQYFSSQTCCHKPLPYAKSTERWRANASTNCAMRIIGRITSCWITKICLLRIFIKHWDLRRLKEVTSMTRYTNPRTHTALITCHHSPDTKKRVRLH